MRPCANGSILESGHEVNFARRLVEDVDTAIMSEEMVVDIKAIIAAGDANYYPVELGVEATGLVLSSLLANGLPSARVMAYDYYWQQRYPNGYLAYLAMRQCEAA